MEKKTIGAFIAALRKANGLTQRELAEKLSVSDKAVSRWERDEALPDLSLIPVLAEVFNVTCDELLKGQRIDPETQIPEKAAAQKEKQIRNLLNSAKTKYQINSIISLGLGLMGLLAALLINFGFLRSYIGFWAGCAFFASAILCQIIFLIQAKARVQSSEIPEDDRKEYLRYIISFGSHMFIGIIAMFAATLPLVIEGDTYYGLTWDFWLPQGIAYAAVFAAVCWILLTTVRFIRRKRNGQSLTNMERFIIKRVALILLIPALTLLAAYGVSTIDQEQFIEPIVFNTWEDFKEVIETPMTHDGRPLTFLEIRTAEEVSIPVANDAPNDNPNETLYYYVFTDESGKEYEIPNPELITIKNAAGKVLCEYLEWNRSIAGIKPNYDEAEKYTRLPVTCYTWTAFNEVSYIFQTITLAILVTGAGMMLFVILHTVKAAKKLKQDET